MTGSSPTPEAHWLCASDALQERGQAVVFDVLLWNQPARAFAMRFDGELVAYINRCAHVPVEMDWQPGHFLDMDQRFILCSMHGAAYEPKTGRCAHGPCGVGKLIRVAVSEQDGQVHWHASRDLLPPVTAAPNISP